MTEVVICGVVSAGRQLGRELGFPTANIAVPEQLSLPDGVYRAEVEVTDAAGRRTSYPAMANLGRNPSVGGSERRLESHLLGFEGSLYGREIRVRLMDWIREERKFDSLEALQAQIEKDKQTILNNL
jgi:riboflavin kinase/FMN adenylyltransferase